jgi:hypothetical protein
MLKQFRNRTELTFAILLVKYVLFAAFLLLITSAIVQAFKLLTPKRHVYYQERQLSQILLFASLNKTAKKTSTPFFQSTTTTETTKSSVLISTLTSLNDNGSVSNNKTERKPKIREYSGEDSATLNSNVHLCPDDGDLNTLKGPIDVNMLLEEFNLTTLVSLHEPQSFHLWKNRYVRPIRHFYLDENNLKAKNKHPRFKEFWDLWHTQNLTVLNISKQLLGGDGERVELGGSWKPKDCDSQHKIAVIIPFRDRIPHLRVSIQYLHTILQRQMSEYRIVVVEGNYAPDTPFNKGRLYNAGTK